MLLSRLFDIVRLGWTDIVFGFGDGLSSTVFSARVHSTDKMIAVFPEADKTKLPHGSSFPTTLFPQYTYICMGIQMLYISLIIVPLWHCESDSSVLPSQIRVQ